MNSQQQAPRHTPTFLEFQEQHKLIKDEYEDKYSSISVKGTFDQLVIFEIYSSKLSKFFNGPTVESTLEAYREGLIGIKTDVVLPTIGKLADLTEVVLIEGDSKLTDDELAELDKVDRSDPDNRYQL